MTLNTQRKSSDAKSSETTAAGLPKAVKVWRNTINGFTNNAWNVCYFNVVDYNFGGYVFDGYAGAVWSKIVIPEPGLYQINSQVLFNLTGVNYSTYTTIYVNGAVMPPPYFQQDGGGAGAFGNEESRLAGPMLLKERDTLELRAYPAGFTSQDIAGYTWLAVTKLGGQY